MVSVKKEDMNLLHKNLPKSFYVFQSASDALKVACSFELRLCGGRHILMMIVNDHHSIYVLQFHPCGVYMYHVITYRIRHH